MPDPNLPFPDHDAAVPPRLAVDLARLFDSDTPVPAHIDEAILADARRRLWAYRFRRRLIRWSPLTAAAAALLLIVYAYRPFQSRDPLPHADVALRDGRAANSPAGARIPSRTSTSPTHIASGSPEDLNRDGRVDILDAFALARRLSRHDPLEPAWDLTADGHIDQRDIDHLAHRAVALPGGPPS